LRNQPKILKLFFNLTLLITAALVLSACGGVPANNFAGLTNDGKTIFVSDQSFLFAADAGSGSILWKYPQKADPATVFFAAPAVANGWVYAGDYKNVLFAFKLEGLDTANPIPNWSFNTNIDKGRMIGSPLVEEGTVLIPSTDFNLYALNATDGTLKWTFKARNALWAQPVSDGKMVYQAGMDHYIYAIDLASGAKRWEVDLGGPILGGATLSKDGILYTGTLKSEIIAVNTNTGKITWRKQLAGNLWSPPLLYNGKLYFGTDQGKVYIMTATEGTIEKTVDGGGTIMAAPVYTKDAVIIVTEAGDVFSLALDGSNKIWTRNVGKGKLYSTPSVIGEQIILASFQGDHLLYGFSITGNPDDKWNSVAPK
jgi:outer membrane protein assembly factor BamB